MPFIKSNLLTTIKCTSSHFLIINTSIVVLNEASKSSPSALKGKGAIASVDSAYKLHACMRLSPSSN